MDICKTIAQELSVRVWQVEAAVSLLDGGSTIPFIVRYRKEATGTLNDEQLRKLGERLKYLRSLEEKKQQALASIEEQGGLTDALAKKMTEAATLVEVEDLYRPFRPKRRTRATIAKEKGLEPFADELYKQKLHQPVEEAAKQYVNEELGVFTTKEAIAGAMDILAERIAEDAACRSAVRELTYEQGMLVTKAKDETVESVYEMYYDFSEPLKRLAGYRVLAINRAEAQKIIRVRMEVPEERIFSCMKHALPLQNNPYTTPILTEMLTDSYHRLLAPAIERELRNRLTEHAEEGAIHVFGENLRQLLLQPPMTGHVVLGWDPAFRTGCKLAIVDATGKVLDTRVIYPTAPQNKVQEAKAVLKKCMEAYGISLISLGNGTASRESEQILSDFLKDNGYTAPYVIVSEAGASVYSASKLGAEEFPNMDVGQRSAVSIARRLQDPLAELVKIEPKAIGVGQYQHDMNQKRLEEALGGVVEACVNQVGVDVNTASVSLLSYVSGIGPALARQIVDYRETIGCFTNRKQLLLVPKLGKKAYEQCAGFLRIRDGEEPLDATGVHPESYPAAKQLLKLCGYTLSDWKCGGIKEWKKAPDNMEQLAAQLAVGVPTLRDIMKELEKPGRDPREDQPRPILRTDVLEMKDLREGMILQGTVRNVMDFGVFVDIGVHQDGLVHISKLTNKKFVRHPFEVVHVGEVVEVQVLRVDEKKKQIQLSMIIQPEKRKTGDKPL